MNAVMVRGQMNQVRGEFRKQWCRLTGNRVGRINGHFLKLFGKAQVGYGRTRDVAGKGIRKITRH
jgi:uncharacterized protein YjbJ (UPF0337 family)